MNILYICTKDPRVVTGGNEQRTNNLWHSLQTLGKVYTIVYEAEGPITPVTEKGENPISFCSTQYNKYYKTIRGAGYSFFEKYLEIGYLPYKFPLPHKPLNIYKGIIFDIVVARYIQMPLKYHFWDIAPLFVDIDDHPLQIFETTKKDLLPTFLQPIGLKFVMKMYEKAQKRMKGGWIANKDLLSYKYPNIKYLPNIPQVPSETYNAHNNDRRYLFTIGMMSYPPNYLGVDKFIKEIWPDFHEKHPNVIYRIGGKGAPEDFATKWNAVEGVEYCGFVSNLEDAYENCIASVVPIYSGGGTCIKTLESLAYSRGCLSTKFGVRGIDEKDVKEQNGLLLFSNAKSFISAYESIIADKNKTIEEGAYKFISQGEFSEQNFKEAVTEFILRGM